ncbi:MAG: YIP1 family protein [Candidatus Hermodarchaeota archaeon]
MSSSEYNTCPSCAAQVPFDYIVCPFCGTSLAKIILTQKREKIPFLEILKRFKILITQPLEVAPLMDTVASNPDRRAGFLLAYGLGIGFILRIFAFAMHFPQTFTIDLISGLVFWFSFCLVGGIITGVLVYIVWLFMSILTNLFSRFLGGKGTLYETVCVTGYGFLPLLLGQLLSVLFLFITLPVAEPSVLATNPVVFIANLLLIPFLGWFILIVGTGLEKTHLLGKIEAFTIITTITIFFALITIFPIFPAIINSIVGPIT